MPKKLTKEEMREYQKQRRAQGKDVKPLVKPPQNTVKPVLNVKPDVKPTMADVDSGKAWLVLAGPNKGGLRWYGPLAQKWLNVPCQIVDGVCVAPHYEGRHVVPQPLDDGAVERARARLR